MVRLKPDTTPKLNLKKKPYKKSDLLAEYAGAGAMRARIRLMLAVASVATVIAAAAAVVHAQLWRGGYGFFGVPKWAASSP